MVKLLENTFRAVNIGLVNEIAMMCDTLGIDVWEVVDAAATKPFGFMPFYPGPGLGGHCIPIDPFYLSWKAKQSGFDARFIELAGEINGHMPEYVVSKITAALNQQRKAVNGSRVLVLGVAYKRDIDDVRESPALDVMKLLHEKGAAGRVQRSACAVPDRRSVAWTAGTGSGRHGPRRRSIVRLRSRYHRSHRIRLRDARRARPEHRRHTERDRPRAAVRTAGVIRLGACGTPSDGRRRLRSSCCYLRGRLHGDGGGHSEPTGMGAVHGAVAGTVIVTEAAAKRSRRRVSSSPWHALRPTRSHGPRRPIGTERFASQTFEPAAVRSPPTCRGSERRSPKSPCRPPKRAGRDPPGGCAGRQRCSSRWEEHAFMARKTVH